MENVQFYKTELSVLKSNITGLLRSP